MRNTNKFMALICASVMFLGSLPTVQAQSDNILASEVFDGMESGADASSVFTVTGTARNKVTDERGAKNKYLTLSNGTLTLEKAISVSEKDVVFGMDVMPVSGNLNMSLSAKDINNIATEILTISSGSIMTPDERSVYTLPQDEFTQIRVHYDRYYSLCSIYIKKNNLWKCILSKAKIKIDGVPVSFIISKKDNNSKVCLDNIVVHNGDNVSVEPDSVAYSEAGEDFIDINDDVGGHLFFASNQTNTGKNDKALPKSLPNYAFVSTGDDAATTTNTAETPYWDDFTKKDQKTYIKLTKNCSQSIHLTVNTNKKQAFYNSTKRESYYIFEADFMRENLAVPVRIPFVRDASTGTNKDCNILTSQPDGSILATDGKAAYGVFQSGKWVNLKVAIDLEAHTADVYVNDKLTLEKIILPASIQDITMFRVIMNSGNGKGDITFDNMHIYGMEKPYDINGDNRTTIFYDDSVVADYLKDKIAFHSYAKLVYANEEKTSVECYYEKDELYVKKASIASVFEWDLTAYEEYVPIKQYAKDVLGYSVMDDGNGLVLLSENKIRLNPDNEIKWGILKPYTNGVREDPTTIEAINDYVFFERPSAEKIKNDFYSGGAENVHPRIFGRQSQFDYLTEKRKNDKFLESLVQNIVQTADKFVEAPDDMADYKFALYRSLDEARKFDQHIEYLAMAYKLTGDRKYFDRALPEIEQILTFPDLNPAHIIDSGSWIEGLAIGYDWFYDLLTQEERDRIAQFVLKNVRVLNGEYYGDFDYRNFKDAKWMSNFNSVYNGGLILACTAFWEYDPALCAETISKALRSYEYTLKGFAPDGAWVESMSYWGLTEEYMCESFSTLESIFGTNYGLSKYQGLDGAMKFFVACSSYAGINNYHDSGASRNMTMWEFAYLANEYEQYGFYALRKHDMENHPERYNYVEVKGTPHELMCYNDKLSEATLDDVYKLDKSMLFRGTELVTYKEQYIGDDALYFSAHFGAVSGYHAHNDTGTFIYDINGYRWAMDPGMQTYNVVKDTEAYRKRTEAHNTLTINNHAGFNQLADGYAPVTRYENNEYGGITVADMSNIYADVNSHTRGFYIADNYRSVTVRDELDLNKESELYWFMSTRAAGAVAGDEVILAQGDEGVSVKFIVEGEGLKDYSISMMDAVPLPESPNPPGQDSNAGIKKIALKIKGNGKINITAKLAPLGESADTTPIYNVPISEWQLPEKAPTYEKPDDLNLGCDIYSACQKIRNGASVAVGTSKKIPTLKADLHDKSNTAEIYPAQTVDENSLIVVKDPTGKFRKAYYVSYVDPNLNVPEGYTGAIISDYTVSETPEADNKGSNIMDNSLGTRWTAHNIGANVVFDMGTPQEIDAVAIAYFKGDLRKYNYEIFVSEDGAKYTSVSKGQSSGKTTELEVFEFNPVVVRYVKIVGYGNSDPEKAEFTNILEAKILKKQTEE